MIYVCIPSYNEASTVGLLLWKIRAVFAGFPREYQLLVLDDGSTDATGEVMEPYTRVLPLTLLRHTQRQGYAASVEALLRKAVELTDRPKRDAAILMHADFTHSPQAIPDLVRRIESGADMVVADGKLTGKVSPGHRLIRRAAPLFFRGVVSIPDVRDLVSGFAIIRLIALRNALRSQPGRLLVCDDWAANAELYWRASRYSRQIQSVPAPERHDLRTRSSRVRPWEMARHLWAARDKLRSTPIAPAAPDRPSSREKEGRTEAVPS